MMTKEGSTKIVNFMTPPPPPSKGSCAGVWSYKSYIQNAVFLLKSSSLFSIPRHKSYKLAI